MSWIFLEEGPVSGKVYEEFVFFCMVYNLLSAQYQVSNCTPDDRLVNPYLFFLNDHPQMQQLFLSTECPPVLAVFPSHILTCSHLPFVHKISYTCQWWPGEDQFVKVVGVSSHSSSYSLKTNSVYDSGETLSQWAQAILSPTSLVTIFLKDEQMSLMIKITPKFFLVLAYDNSLHEQSCSEKTIVQRRTGYMQLFWASTLANKDEIIRFYAFIRRGTISK
jgi:hypothetical protein